MSLVNTCFELPDGQVVLSGRCAACYSPQSAMPKSATSRVHIVPPELPQAVASSSLRVLRMLFPHY